MDMTEYDIQAAEFLKKAETNMTISRIGEVQGFPGFNNDAWRYKYQITLTRHKKQYRFTFYDCHLNWKYNKRPSRYSVLASVEKYEPADTVEGFAWEFGYMIDDDKEYKRVKKIYEACKKQYERLLDLFGEDLMKDLREIN